MPAHGSGPSAVLAESLAALSTSAHQALAEVEARARQDVAKASSDAREARTERDKALEALHSVELEVQTLQKEVASLKATLTQTELSASHHKETIVQLRREATQWRDQSHNWQEHFLRVEQERCSLTTRNEELVSERLHWYRSLPTPFTPNHPSTDTILSATSPKSNPASTSSHKRPISPPDVDSPSTSISAYKSKRITSKPIPVKDPLPTRKLFSHDSTLNQNSNVQSSRIHQSSPSNPTRSQSRTTVLRRVHAVINVKEEESDRESGQLKAKNRVTGLNTGCVPSRKRKAVLNHDEDCVSNEGSDHASSGSDQYSEYGDNEEVIDEEDDELMLGGEAFEDKHGRAPRNASNQQLSTLPSKKRKISTGSDRSRTRRKH
ncbi:hypothetical protein C0992_012722 [Termitomyces sp. T32_za158]|nr:hypothetical protein C0992_012722 [Termitomyces sp. T32_za158]